MSSEYPIVGRGKPSRSIVGSGPTPAKPVASSSGSHARSPSPSPALPHRPHAPPALTITSPGGPQPMHSPATPGSAGGPPSPALPRRPSFGRSPSPSPAAASTAATAPPALPPATHRRPSFTSPSSANTTGASARSPSPAPAPTASPEMQSAASPTPPPALPLAPHRLSITRANSSAGAAETTTTAASPAPATTPAGNATPAVAPAPPPPSPAVAAARAAAAAALLPAPVLALPPAPVVPVVPEVTSIDESIDPGKSAEDRVTRYRLRRKVASEILATEQSYLASLNRMQDVYISALLDPHHGLLTSAQGATLFSNIPVLIPLQQQFLDGMQALLDKWTPETQEMGDLFLKFAPFFKMYTQYVNNYETAMSLLTKLDKSEPFSALCRKLRATHGGLLDISSYLIQPIQRIPRYKLLIFELLRYTNPLHADHAKLTKAQELIADVALHINEAVRLQQNSQALLTLQERFVDGTALQLIGPNGNGVPGPRRLILQGPLSKRGRRSDTIYHFLLFSDFLLYAARSGASRFKLHRKIFVNQFFSWLDVPDIPLPKGAEQSGTDANPNGDRFQLQILSAQKSFVVVAADAATKASWVAALSEAIAEFKRAAEAAGHSGLQQQASSDVAQPSTPGPGSPAAARTISLAPPTPSQLPRRGSTPNISLNPSQSAMLSAISSSSSSQSAAEARGSDDFGTQQPVFQQFKSNSVCVVCATKCSFAGGRHHCRACGSIVCNSCSKERVYLSWTKQRSRACDRCCQKMKDERSIKIEKIQRLTAATQQPATSAAAAATSPTPSTPQSAASLACPAVLSPVSGAPPPRPPRPAVPSRPHQDQLLKLLDELLETTPRMETAHATSIAEAKMRTSGAVATRVPSASVSVRPASLGPPAVAALPADLKGALPVAKFSEEKQAPKIVGQLPFVRARGGPGGKGGKQRSHSVMVGNASSPPSISKSSSNSGSDQNPWENDGLSDSDEEANWDPQSSIGRPAGASFSHHSNSVAEEDEGDDDVEPHSASISSLRSPVSVSRTSAVGAALHSAAPPPPTSARPKLLDSPAVAATRSWIGMVRVLYAFTAMDASQLSCSPGDLIALTSCSHDAWWRGDVIAPDGTVSAKGLFPSAFVFDLRENKSSEAGSVAPGGDIYESVGDYKVATEGHLHLARGDLLIARQKHANGWWAMCHGATKITGWVPSNYLASCSTTAAATPSGSGSGTSAPAGSGSGTTKFAPLTPAQEEKLNLVLSRASAVSPAPSAAPATPIASSYSQSPSRGAATGGGLLSTLKLRLGNSMTLGAKSPPPRGTSLSVSASPSPSSGSSAAGALMVGSPPPARSGGLGPGAPPVPSRAIAGRSNSVMSPSASSSPPSTALPSITPERAKERKSIMQSLKGFFASRPSKEALAKKGILKEAK